MCTGSGVLAVDAARLGAVNSTLSGPEETLRRLTKAGLSASVSDRISLPFGPVMTERLPWPRGRGLIPQEVTREQLVVIRARKD